MLPKMYNSLKRLSDTMQSSNALPRMAPNFLENIGEYSRMFKTSMQTCPEIRLCCWSFHNPWESHCHLGSSCHMFANWTPRTDPGSASVLSCFFLKTRIIKEFTRNSSYTLLMLLVRAFPRIPPISTFSSFRNWGKYFQVFFLIHKMFNLFSATEELKTK